MSGYRVRNHIERVHTFLPMLIEHRLTIHGLFEIFDVAHIKGEQADDPIFRRFLCTRWIIFTKASPVH